jgi:predicted RNA-binding Zn-ribbon protein involved in translation (DUF1610 family)
MKVKHLEETIQLCTKCGFFKPAKNDGNTEYCSRCGEQMISECYYCEKPLTDPHASFCERCGEKIKENEK